MLESTLKWLSSDGFMPHGYCYLWTPQLLWTFVISEAMIALAYFSIPFGLMYFVQKRKDLRFNWIFKLFSAFILSCGVTHLLGIWTIWHAHYWLDAFANSITAIISLIAAIALWPLIPIALKQPSTQQLHEAYRQLEAINKQLEVEIEQKNTAVQEMQKAKVFAEAANIAKSTFIATMSHELRTPLNAILGFSELMSQDESTTITQKEKLDIINRSGTHLLSMINDVLDISKIEAGRLDLDIQAFDLLKLLEDIGNMFRVRAANKQLSFRLEVDPDITPYIKTDSGKLRQILINLLGNALKFTHHGGIILRAHTRPLPNLTLVMLSIEIVDSGSGIPADQLQELFKPFVQLAQENSDLKGTGLGLTISKSLIELMGGNISVHSVLGVGSTFTMQLPVSIAAAQQITVEKNARIVKGLAENQPQWRLLVVDDSYENRLLLVTLLAKVGFAVREAENGKEAIKVFENWHPHLIWMDMRMPVMDGYAATEKIRYMPEGDMVKIIALTASAFKEQHYRIINAGCDDVLHKPFNSAEIFAALSNYLGVKFIYRDEPTPPSLPSPETTAEILSKLPPELRQQLHEAALNLDTEATETVISKIREIAPDLANGLENLANSYQFQQLIELTNQ